MKNTDERRIRWAGRVDDIHPEFADYLSSSMNTAAMQVEIIGILIDILREHGLFATILHREGGTSYRIAIKFKPEYRFSNITQIRVNFNRYNLALILTDDSGNLTFGTFRFRTIINNFVKCTLTSMVHYATDADERLVEELKEVFHKTETIYCSNERCYKELEEEIDFDKTTMYELCHIYASDRLIAGKLSRCGYKDMTVKEFVNSIDLNDLKKRPGIGTKTITMLNEMYIYYGLDKLKEE